MYVGQTKQSITSPPPHLAKAIKTSRGQLTQSLSESSASIEGFKGFDANHLSSPDALKKEIPPPSSAIQVRKF
ncbi:unnamed protein product [Protopolystoma xenopodis]|uniref:Uncharacterized protein n=1 Tax=Protopolystoma xenopodis TaxID=117903 RepID=A0A448WZS7_9PLAT|nr:unnamed protein product [Protopolystoma xenopodis]